MSVYELLDVVTSALEQASITYTVTGSVASFEHGRIRSTADIDVVVQLCTNDDVDRLIEALPNDRFLADRQTIHHAVAQRSMFNMIDSVTGMKIDFIIPQNVYDRRCLERGSYRETHGGVRARFATVEDVILNKLLFYAKGGSDKHLSDISAMIRISHERLDFNYLEEWADALDVHQLWREVRRRTPMT